MVKNIFSKLVIVMMAAILSLSFVYSAGLSVSLASQNPDPVSPGNFVFVNVKISNSGSESIRNAQVTMVENDNFKIAQGSEITKNLGTIPAYSSQSSTSAIIAKFKVFVDESTPIGLNTIQFNVVDGFNGINEYDFNILVQDNNPTIQLSKFEVPTIEPGKNAQLTIELENTNSIQLNDVVLKLNLDEVEDEIVSVSSGSNELNIKHIMPNSKKSATFDLAVSPDASSKPYLIPVTITFEDNLGNTYTQDTIGSIKVYSVPQLSLKVDSQDIYTKGNGKVSLAIANPGTSSIKGTQIEILPSDSYSIIEGETQYIGDLNPDDFQTAQTQIYINNNQEATLNVKLTYSDSYNNKNEQILELPLKIYSQEQLNEFGISGGSSQSGGGVAGYIVTIILIGIAFYIGRRVGKKSRKK